MLVANATSKGFVQTPQVSGRVLEDASRNIDIDPSDIESISYADRQPQRFIALLLPIFCGCKPP
ncbi:MAG: hypothetical protein LBS01_10635 [Prevotellaceae bacterium]|nr:hypothetical protein [Prevotellaceae bacterium]